MRQRPQRSALTGAAD